MPREVPEKRSAMNNWLQISSYVGQFHLLNLLPFVMFMSLSDILLLVKLSNESNQLQLQEHGNLARPAGVSKLPTTKIERAKGEFYLIACRSVNNLHEFMSFYVITSLKERIWQLCDSS